jgi:phytoene dehydrogenase-like protein
MTTEAVDAVVVGSGPNGLVAAIALADAGWQVLMVEGQSRLGGAVASGEVTAPGYTTDLFSAFYPLAAASPVIRDLDLRSHGLRWVNAPDVLAHPLTDGSCAVLSTDPTRTAANLETFAPGDGDAWLAMVAHWNRVGDGLLDALFTPFPPVRPVAGLLRRVGPAGVLELARLAALPVHRLAKESFAGAGGGLLLSGNALHADIPPVAAGSGLFGWLLSMLGQDVGFPVPQGGAGRLADALAARLVAAGGAIRTGVPVTSIRVVNGRAAGVECADGTRITARRAVVADVSAPALYRELVDARHLPPGLLPALDHFEWDHATLKVNWALRSPIPWRAPGVRGAGTVHLGTDTDGMIDFAADLAVGRMPERPFLLLGQMSTADPTRSPAGTESAWAYTHVPRNATAECLDRQVHRVTDTVERFAPGFRDLIVARAVQLPADLQAADANLVGGAINGGTAAIHQQLVFRPVPGLGRPETPISGLYLASAAAHPGGGVHGACGWNAARAALATDGWFGGLRRRLNRTAWSRLLPAG